MIPHGWGEYAQAAGPQVTTLMGCHSLSDPSHADNAPGLPREFHRPDLHLIPGALGRGTRGIEDVFQTD